jgi:hypothetical protein
MAKDKRIKHSVNLNSLEIENIKSNISSITIKTIFLISVKLKYKTDYKLDLQIY